MSFIDYGLDVFGWGSGDRSRLQSCGDCGTVPDDGDDNSGASCCHVIIDHLIELGSRTEARLVAANRELDKYRALKFTDEQVQQLQREDAEYTKQNNGFFIAEHPFEYYTTSDDNNASKNEPEESELCSSCRKPITPRQGTCVPESSIRETIIQKDSEIISLMNEKAVKETEVKELEEQNRRLQLVMEKMKDDIDLLESSSRISQTKIEDVVLQKNRKLDTLRESVEKLERDLEEERQDRKLVEREMTTLQNLVREAKALRKNLSDELKASKQRVESLESTNSTLSATIKQLQLDRDVLDRKSSMQETDIEKLLSIIKRINEKYERSEEEVKSVRRDLDERERKLSQCREQLETMEREVGRLIGDLAEALGQHEADDCNRELTRLREDQRQNMYDQARQLTRGLNKIVKEHEQCHLHRLDLMKQIHRLGAMNRARRIARPTGSIREVKSCASQEISRLKRVVLGADNYQAIKTDLNDIIDELLQRIDGRRIDTTERTYLRVAGEASLALEKLGQKVNDHEIYRKCENFLLLELENLQQALDGAEKTINGLEVSPLERNDAGDMRKALEDTGSYAVIESLLSKKVLEQVQNSTQIVVRITTALRDESSSKLPSSKKLESQLQQALLELNELGVEKCQLQSDYNESLKRNKELGDEVEKLKASLADVQSRYDSLQRDSEKHRKQAAAFEKKYRDSHAENAALVDKSDEIVQSFRAQLQSRDVKLREYRKFNDFLSSKLEESGKTIEQLQSSIVEENLRKVDLDSFLQLAREKAELTERTAALEVQLASYERGNGRVQANLAKIQEDNEFLEMRIKEFKRENERMEKSIAEGKDVQKKLGSRCDELLQKIESIARCSRMAQEDGRGGKKEAAERVVEREVKILKEKLRHQQKEITSKEQVIADKTKRIEHLTEQIAKLKDETSPNSPAALLKRIETLNREKSELKKELSQTQSRYEDKLADMHKQYKHNEIELHKNHNDSIRRLEAKYEEMMRDEGKMFSYSRAWLQSLNAREMQELHDEICRTPLCPKSTFEKDLYEEQKRRQHNPIRTTPTNYGVKKALPNKKDVRTARNLLSNSSKPNSRQRLSARDSLSNQSIIIPEKEYPHGVGNVRSDPVGRHK